MLYIYAPPLFPPSRAPPARPPATTLPQQSALPSVQVMFASQPYVVNLMLFYFCFGPLVTLMFPLAVIDLAGGFLFGVWVGFPLALLTKTCGSVLCFLLSRNTCGYVLIFGGGGSNGGYLQLNTLSKWGQKRLCFSFNQLSPMRVAQHRQT